MNGLPRHPGTEEIAEFRAGATDGARGDQVAAHLAECPECRSISARLDRVPLILASVPPPALPASIEARIMAALSAESAARSAGLVAPDGKVRHLIGRSPAHAGPGGRPPAWVRQPLVAPLGVLVAAAACLILAFVGLRLSGQGHPSTSAAAGHRPGLDAGRPAARGVAGPRQNSTSPALRERASFRVLVSSVNFQQPTLQAQVQHQLAAPSGDDRISPPAPLVGCVARLAGENRLVLVEEARYQSQPAYVIVIPGHIWAVARRCTSTDPAMLASVALPPGR